MSKPEPMRPAQYYPPCTRHELVVAPMLGWNHAGKLLSYAVNAKRILEYGSGGSTLWLAQHCRHANIVSIEHDPKWYEWVRCAEQRLRDVRILLRYHLSIALQVSDDYVRNRSVDGLMPYDLIFIDGAHEQRTPCLKAAHNLLAPGGVAILDNSEEPAYQEGKTFLLSQPGMVLIEETEDNTWDPNRSHRHLWIAQKGEANPA